MHTDLSPAANTAVTEPAPPDPTDLMAVVTRYQSPLLRYVGHLLGQMGHESAEDIVQETFIRLHRQVQNKGAHSIRTCALLDKPSRRVIPCEADHVGFTIEDMFVVGYGLDYDSCYRELPYIAKVTFD